MITINELFHSVNQCCGCGSCANICPESVIEMNPDQLGFLYPKIINKNQCIDCKLCMKVCPIKYVDNIHSQFIDFYAGYIADKAELISSASGGLATAVSQKFIQTGGIVYGVRYTTDWSGVTYQRADRVEALESFKTSKYAQSVKDDVYTQVLLDLKKGIKVLFVGLPCDILAIKIRVPSRLQNNLFLMELVCHGPTSQEVQKQFIMHLTKNGNSISFFSTRAKRDGKWKPFYICAKFDNGSVFFEKFHKSAYGAAFRYLKRPSCYTCRVKGEHLAGDLMIGDYHYVEKGMRGFNKHGVSSALVHNQKGQELLSDLSGFILFAISKRGALGNAAITKAIPAPNLQKKFEEDFIRNGLFHAYRLPFVRKSNIKRDFISIIMNIGVKVKRFLFPHRDSMIDFDRRNNPLL